MTTHVQLRAYAFTDRRPLSERLLGLAQRAGQPSVVSMAGGQRDSCWPQCSFSCPPRSQCGEEGDSGGRGWAREAAAPGASWRPRQRTVIVELRVAVPCDGEVHKFQDTAVVPPGPALTSHPPTKVHPTSRSGASPLHVWTCNASNSREGVRNANFPASCRIGLRHVPRAPGSLGAKCEQRWARGQVGRTVSSPVCGRRPHWGAGRGACARRDTRGSHVVG